MTGILYLGKNSLALYDEKTKRIFQLNFRPEVVKDLEVINPDQLNLSVKSLVDSNKIVPSALIMIVSHNMFFEKDFPPLSKEQQVIEIQKFLDNVPFETIRAKTFQSAKTNKIVAANGHFIDSVKKAFEPLGFAITIAIPSMAFGIVDEGLNQGTIRLILSKHNSFKQYNLLKDETLDANPPVSQKESEREINGEKNKEKLNRKNLIAIGIFVLLIVVLSIIVFFVLSSQNSSPKKTSTANTNLIVKQPIDKLFSI